MIRRPPKSTLFPSPTLFRSIPAALIDRVDILTGGASAVYGADVDQIGRAHVCTQSLAYIVCRSLPEKKTLSDISYQCKTYRARPGIHTSSSLIRSKRTPTWN